MKRSAITAARRALAWLLCVLMLAGKDKKVCRVGREGCLLVFVIGDSTLRLDEDQDGCFVSFLADMTADTPRYDHIDLEFRDAGVDLTVRVERQIAV